MKKLFLPFLFGICIFFTPISETNAHPLIPDEIMQAIIENPEITDTEIEQMFIDLYNVSSQEFLAKRQQEEQEEIMKSLEGDADFDEYKTQKEEEYQKYLAEQDNEITPEEKKQMEVSNKILGENSIPKLGFFERIQKKEFFLINKIRVGIFNNSLTIWESIKTSVYAGILHIIGGIDHILFFLTLLLVSRPTKQLFLIITSFTLAHSITLVLVGTKVLSINLVLIESIIAFSIAYSALSAAVLLYTKDENHTTKFWNKEFIHTLIVIFVFGLFHGMGFAEVFDEFSFQTTEYIFPLLLYNGGIEIGQLILLGIFLPLLHYIYKKKWERKILIPSAIILSLISFYWVFERVIPI